MILSVKKVFKIFLFIYLVVFASGVSAATQWQKVAPGIDYTSIANPTLHSFGFIHCFKINLKNNVIQSAFAKDDLFPAETVKWLAKRNNALIAVNGGFFTSSWNPIGLRIQNFQQRNPLQPTSWWPIFYLKKNTPYIVDEKNYQKDSAISFAIQGGPRLLRNGLIPSLKPGKAERTALGITPQNEVIIAATENWPLSTEQLAHVFKEKLNCPQAMNLDGGSSTQMYANVGKVHIDVASLALITDIVYITTKTTLP